MSKINLLQATSEALQGLNDFGLLDSIDSLTGKFKAKRRVNKRGVEKFITTFKIDQFPGKDGVIKFKGKADSLLGEAENQRFVGSGNMKLDYNDDDGSKIAEVSVEQHFVDTFLDFSKITGSIRISFDNDSIALSTASGSAFNPNKILTASFDSSLL